MGIAEIDALLADNRKRLPASPRWIEQKQRIGEMRARLPVEVEGETGRAEIEITTRMSDPRWIVIVLLVPQCISRLCIGTGHRNKVTGETTETPHFHAWSDNRHLNARTRETLPFAVTLPSHIASRDAAFAWFLEQTGIESPSWLPVIWPGQGGLL